MNSEDNEIPKYKKKSKKRPPTKSNHKHDYSENVLVKHEYKFMGENHYSYSPGKRCIICGKVQEDWFPVCDKTEDGCYRMLSNEEILDRYKGFLIIDYD